MANVERLIERRKIYLKIIEMKKLGYRNKDIAETLSISPQMVSYITRMNNSESVDYVAYYKLRKWMIENRITSISLAYMLNVSKVKMVSYLEGTIKIPDEMWEQLSEITGMSIRDVSMCRVKLHYIEMQKVKIINDKASHRRQSKRKRLIKEKINSLIKQEQKKEEAKIKREQKKKSRNCRNSAKHKIRKKPPKSDTPEGAAGV